MSLATPLLRTRMAVARPARPTAGLLLHLRPAARTPVRFASVARGVNKHTNWDRPTPSQRVAAQEMGELPNDLGLCPDTFIMPFGKNKPSLLTNPKVRAQLEWRRLVTKAKDLKDKVIFRLYAKQKLLLWEPKSIAVDFHKQMYTAFARGDLNSLREICGDGLMESFMKRIFARGNQKMEWRIEKYLSRPRVVSNKCHFYPGIKVCRKQAVVRIHTLQSLTKFDARGRPVEGTGVPKEVVEYVVVEKKKLGPQPWSGWFVWGTTTESSVTEK